MSRLLKGLLVCLLLLLGAVAGCGGQSGGDRADEWNRLMDQANALIDGTIAGTTQNAELLGKVNGIDPTAKNAADALPLLADVVANLGEMKQSQESLAALCDKLAKLDVSEEDKTYARQQKEIAELNVESFALVFDMLANYEFLYSKGRTLSQAKLEQNGKERTEIIAKYNEMYGRIGDKVQASEQYRADNPGGE